MGAWHASAARCASFSGAVLLVAVGCSGEIRDAKDLDPRAPSNIDDGENDPNGRGGGSSNDPDNPDGSGGNGSGGNGGDGSGGADDGAPRDGIAACDDRTLPAQPLRRLSSTQYHNTLDDLFGATLAEPLLQDSLYPETIIDRGFGNDAEANAVNTAESNAIEDNAERIAQIVLDASDSYFKALLPCSLPGSYDDADVDACIPDFIEQFGLRAYRRPLSTGERDIAQGLYDTLRDEQSAAESFAALVQLFVQAPALLYRVERGAEEVVPGLLRLTDYEMASRLSYFFLNSMPDDELMTEAAAGRLSTAAEVETQARRLLDSPRFEDVISAFHEEWLHLYELERSNKDVDLFPDLTPEVRDALEEEVPELLRHVLEEADGSLTTLLTTTTLPVNDALASFYGVDASGADASTWVPVDVPNRRGLFSLASFMATHAADDRTNPITRGAFFQSEVLCAALPVFPGNLDIATPLQDTSMLPTARERLAPLLEISPCAGCHAQFNPTGLAFENYDAVGQWRDRENGADIDASGVLNLDGDMMTFDTALEMLDMVGHSEQVRDCYTLQWYRSLLGRREFPEDQCSIEAAQRVVADNDGDLRELFVALTQTDGFLYRRALDPDEVQP